jgi:hypothetical protein
MSIVYFSIFETPQPGGPGSCIYFPQEQVVTYSIRQIKLNTASWVPDNTRIWRKSFVGKSGANE